MVCYYHEGYCVLTPTDPILYLVRVTIYFALKVIRLSELFVDIKKHQTDVNTSLAKYGMLYTLRSLIVFCGNCTK